MAGWDTAAQVAWLRDGGRGFWRLYDLFVDDAIGVLDCYQAAQPLWKAAAAGWEGRTQQAKDGGQPSHHQLRPGAADAVIADLANALALNDLSESARAAITQVHDYLTKHQNHIDDERFKPLGLPLGVGWSKALVNG